MKQFNINLKNIKVMYLDFDNTCYNTVKLTEDMLNVLINDLINIGIDKNVAQSLCKENFCREVTYDIFELVDLINSKIQENGKMIDVEKIKKNILEIIVNGKYIEDGIEKTYLFDDVGDSLRKIKDKYQNIKICLLTSATSKIFTQYQKVKYSKILDLEDAMGEKLIDKCVIVVPENDKYIEEITNLRNENNIFCIKEDDEYDLSCKKEFTNKITIAFSPEKFNLEGLNNLSIAVDDRTKDIVGLRENGIKMVFAINREEGKEEYKKKLNEFLETNEDENIIEIKSLEELANIL